MTTTGRNSLARVLATNPPTAVLPIRLPVPTTEMDGRETRAACLGGANLKSAPS